MSPIIYRSAVNMKSAMCKLIHVYSLFNARNHCKYFRKQVK